MSMRRMRRGLSGGGIPRLDRAWLPTLRGAYTANFQTNIISGVTSNWSGEYYVIGLGTYADELLIKMAAFLPTRMVRGPERQQQQRKP